LALRTGVPEFALSETQNREVAAAVGNVARHYPGIALSEKQQDIAILLYTLIRVGNTQRLAYRERVTKNDK
jgi:hypothetical protein